MDELSQDFDLFGGQLDEETPETEVVEEDLFGGALDSEPTSEEETATAPEETTTVDDVTTEVEPTETTEEDMSEVDVETIVNQLL
jgi:hypothetical protein